MGYARYFRSVITLDGSTNDVEQNWFRIDKFDPLGQRLINCKEETRDRRAVFRQITDGALLAGPASLRNLA